MPQKSQWALWHVVYEALANAIRHGQPRHVDVHLMRQSGHLLCAVRDDGAGFNQAADPGESHHGLRNMRRRIEGLGGRLTILSARGRGTMVIADIPL